MEKSEAIKLAVDLIKPFIEKEQLRLGVGVKNSPKEILDELEEMAKGIIEIEKKI